MFQSQIIADDPEVTQSRSRSTPRLTKVQKVRDRAPRGLGSDRLT